MKLYGIFGKGTGRKGDAVFAINHGVQVVRQYNPIVSNPKSAKQIDVRSRLKLMSQLSAVMANDIAIQRIGLKSARNLFVSKNYPLTSYADNTAAIDLNRVQLTASNTQMAQFEADRTDGSHLNVQLMTNEGENLSEVIYVAYAKKADQSLVKLGSTVVTESGANGTFNGVLPYNAGAVVIYAYGVRNLSSRADVMFGNLVAPTSESVAKLVTSRALRLSDAALTETNALTMEVGDSRGESEYVNRVNITLQASGNGTVSGAGRVPVGTVVTIHAVSGEGAVFGGWYHGGVDGRLVSTEANYTFTAMENITLVAKFLGAPVTLSLSASPADAGTVNGAGQFESGTTVTAVATARTGYRFVRWEEDGQSVSTTASYTFNINSNRSLVAVFEVYVAPAHISASFVSGGSVASYFPNDVYLQYSVADAGQWRYADEGTTVGGTRTYEISRGLDIRLVDDSGEAVVGSVRIGSIGGEDITSKAGQNGEGLLVEGDYALYFTLQS